MSSKCYACEEMNERLQKILRCLVAKFCPDGVTLTNREIEESPPIVMGYFPNSINLRLDKTTSKAEEYDKTHADRRA